jgi:hypothetical protein
MKPLHCLLVFQRDFHRILNYPISDVTDKIDPLLDQNILKSIIISFLGQEMVITDV